MGEKYKMVFGVIGVLIAVSFAHSAFADSKCPGNSVFDSESRICVEKESAVGPFTGAMIEICRQSGGGPDCETQKWELKFAKEIRGSQYCPIGSAFSSTLQTCVDSTSAYGPFSEGIIENCKVKGGSEELCENSLKLPLKFLDGSGSGELFCPIPSKYDASTKLCLEGTEAIGPFSPKMREKCRTEGGAEVCDTDRWDAPFAASLREDARCPLGTTLNTTVNACIQGEEAFGPFTKKQVEFCIENGGGDICTTLRVHESFLPQIDVFFDVTYKGVSWKKEWSQFVGDAVQNYAPELLDDRFLAPIKGLSEICPGIQGSSESEKKSFYALFFASVSYFESGYNPKAFLDEPGSLAGVRSEGLLQVSKQDWKSHGEQCRFNSTDRKISDPAANLKCGVVILKNQFKSRKSLFTPDKYYYWSVLKNKVPGIKEIFNSHKENLKFCKK